MSNVKMTEIKNIPANKKWDEFFSVSNAEKARKFHEGIPEYEKTPLACLSDLADHLEVWPECFQGARWELCSRQTYTICSWNKTKKTISRKEGRK